MIRRVAALLSVCAVAAVMHAGRADVPPQPGTDAEMVRALTPSVVNIRVVADTPTTPGPGPDRAAVRTAAQPRIMSGSGFVVDASGLIATNAHVIDGATHIQVIFADGASFAAEIVDSIRMLDLAVLRVAAGHPLTPVRWSETAAQPGDEVFAFGNPMGIGLSVSAGIVSALNRDLQETPYDNFLQTDTVINHGNSGGPLFNARGEVVGIDTAIVSPTAGYSGLGFAIPTRTARFAIDRVRQYGWLRPGWIGATANGVTSDMAAVLGAPGLAGVMIGAVADAGPAARAGLRVGDVVTRVDGRAPEDGRAFHRAVIAAPVGGVLPLTVWRAGRESVLPVAVAEWPRADYDRLNGRPDLRTPPDIRPDLGLALRTLTDAGRAQHGLPPGQAGVLVVGVMAGTDAWLRGIGEGDVILRSQAGPAAKPADVQNAVAAARAARQDFILVLVQPHDAADLGPRWIALRVANRRPAGPAQAAR